MTTTEQLPTTRRPRVASVPVDTLDFHPRNIRRDLGDLRELAASIAEVGVLEPLLVEDRGARGRVLAGHRRLAAARLAGVRRVPVMIVEAHTDDDAIAVMVAENRHRMGITPGEKTSAARALAYEFGWPQARIARRLGVHPQTVGRWLAGRDDHEPTVAQERQATERGRRAAATRNAHRRAPTTVGVRAVHDVAARWEGHAPPALVAELRALLGGWSP